MNVLGQHFRELGLRWAYIGICFGLTFFTCYFYRLEFLYIFTRPFCVAKKHYFNNPNSNDCGFAPLDNHSQPLLGYSGAAHSVPPLAEETSAGFIFTDLAEGFYTTLEICLVASIFCTLPFIIYQIYCFLGPSCYLQERKHLLVGCLLELGCFIIVLCVHLFLFPEICRFLFTFQVHYSFLTLELQARIHSFVHLAARVMLISLFSMQIPVIGIMLIRTNWMTVNDSSQLQINSNVTVEGSNIKLAWPRLLGHRKIVFFISLILSAALSPPDMYIQIFVSLFFVCIFEFLVCYGYVHQRKSRIS